MNFSDTAENRELNVEYIQEQLDEAYKHLEEARASDLVLVIGCTGVGKSTTCNYLLGHQMRVGKCNGTSIIETDVETNLKIGHSVESETLYAKSVPIALSAADKNTVSSKQKYCLLDCPGFLGNRTKETRVIESVSTELAIRKAEKIICILILIPYHSIHDTRLTDIRNLVKILNSLFTNPVEIVQHSVLVITKKYAGVPDDVAREETIGILNALKCNCEKQANSLLKNPTLSSVEGLTYRDYDRIASYVSALLKQDIVFINPLDNGESKKLIFDQINNRIPRIGYWGTLTTKAQRFIGIHTNSPIQPLSIKDFNFAQYDENRIAFDKALNDRADSGYLLIRKILDCDERIRCYSSEVDNCLEKISTLKTLQLNLEDELFKTKSGKCDYLSTDFKSVKDLELMFARNIIRIDSKQFDVNQNNASQKELSEELKSINTDVPVVFMKKCMEKNVFILNFFGYEEMEFFSDTGSTAVKIIKVDKTMENGVWKEELDKREMGIYNIKYESDFWARPAKASVTVYVKAKDDASNKIRINQIHKETTTLMKRKEQLLLEISDLECQDQSLQIAVEQSKTNINAYISDLNKKLIKCKDDIPQASSMVDMILQDIEKDNNSLSIYLQEFNTNRHKFDILVSISDVFKISTTIVKQFISLYKFFLSTRDELKCNFGDENKKDFFYCKKADNSHQIPKDFQRSSSTSSLSSMKFDINPETFDELQTRRDKVLKEIQIIKVQLENKENELKSIINELEKKQ